MKSRLLVALVAGLLLPSAVTAEESAGNVRAAWLKHCQSVRREPSLVRFYLFEGIDPAKPIPSATGPGGELTYQASPKPGEKAKPPQIVEGRWPGKKAVQLDAGSLLGATPKLTDKGFTVEAWVRVHGPGSLSGNNGATNGTLLALGNGYWDGWRITTSYPEKAISFEIGRPQPSHSVGTRTSAVADRVWHHVAATWDGKKMLVFVDGIQAAAGDHAGTLTLPSGEKMFRIGYANAGIGSVVLDVDEVALFGRALAPADILRHACFDSPASEQVVTRLQAASSLVLEKKLRDAGRLLVEVLDSPDLPDRYRALAAPMLASVLRQSPIHALSPKAAALLLAQPQIAQAERINIQLAAGQGLSNAGNHEAARQEYRKLLAEPGLLPYVRGLAQLRIARTHVAEKNADAAKAEYAKVLAMNDLPPHLHWEASQRLREIEQPGTANTTSGRMSRPARPEPAVTLHVAPSGADANPGTAEKPFATLERARDALRQLRTASKLAKGGAAVIVRGGEYSVKQTFTLEAQDSGTEASPIVYRAAPGEKPIFRGGIRIEGFQPVADQAILARLPEEARGKVVALDVKKFGLKDLKPLKLAGYASGSGFKTYPVIELFFNGKAMPISRWPNEGFVRIADVSVPDDHQIHGRKGSKTGRFTFEGDRPQRWKDEKEAYLYGYWFWDWADSYERIAGIDAAKREFTLATPFHHYGYRKDAPYYAVNLLSEIDAPGEWYLDRAAGMLYFYPPSDPAGAVVEISTLEAPLLQMDKVAHVAFEGLTWDLGCVDGLVLRGCENCLLAGCTARRFAGNGVMVEGGHGTGLLSCDVYSMGRGGLVITGGDRKTLTPGRQFVENCDIRELSRIDHTYTPAILLNGVGNRLAHNNLHHINSSAVRLEGNDHLVECNAVHHVVQESDDQGGVDMFGNATYRGNVYRYNFWHHIGNQHNPVEEPECGQAGIRFDDAICGQVVYGNVFYRCSAGKHGFGGVQIHGGKDNWIDNNLFIDCMAAVSFSPWDLPKWKERTDNAMKAGEIDAALYLKRYPDLARLSEGLNVNLLGRNLAFRCGEFLRRDRGYAQLFANLALDQDPGFADAAGGNFTLPADVAQRLGLEPIPFDQIGLYRDAEHPRD